MAAGAWSPDLGTAQNAEADRYLVATHDLPLVDEGNGEDKHLTADAQVELGRRVSLAFREHLLGEDVDGTGPRVEDVDASSNGTTIDIHFDRAVTAPDSPGADAYGGYFSVFDDDGAVPIAEVARDAEDRIRITLQRPAAGTPSVRYMPPPVALAEIETNVVRAAACEERGPGDTCLPLPAFGVTPSTSLSDLRFPETHDE